MGVEDEGILRDILILCPLDVHSRELGLLCRKQNDAKAVRELDGVLRSMDRNDPVKYDFALFGLGVSEKHRPATRELY